MEKTESQTDSSISDLVMELLVVVDQSYTSYHKEDTLNYTKLLLTGANDLFQHPSLGLGPEFPESRVKSFQLKLVDFGTLDMNLDIFFPKGEDYFFKFNIKNGYLKTEDSVFSTFDYDGVLFLTRLNLVRILGHDAIGYSVAWSACRRLNFRIIQDCGLFTSKIIAHEVGHMYDEFHIPIYSP